MSWIISTAKKDLLWPFVLSTSSLLVLRYLCRQDSDAPMASSIAWRKVGLKKHKNTFLGKTILEERLFGFVFLYLFFEGRVGLFLISKCVKKIVKL